MQVASFGSIMRDLDVRLAVRSRLSDEHAGDLDTRIVEEMGIWHGSVRIDLAVINGEIAGYELKSARDTLQRLPNQAKLYGQVFDRVHLVAAEKHIEHALSELPSWWGIIVAREAAGGVELEVHRQSERNPVVDPMQVARLLWREETLDILSRHRLDRGVRSASRDKVAARLVDSFEPHEVATHVRRALKDRAAWLGQPVCHQGHVPVSSEL